MDIDFFPAFQLQIIKNLRAAKSFALQFGV